MKFVPEERAKKLSFDRMIFKLVPTDETKAIWGDKHFEYRVDVTLRADCLEWDLIVVNEGDEPFDYTLGMHTYFDVSSLKNVKISGPFKGAETVDKTNGAVGKADSDDIVIDKPVDMLYKGVKGPVTITDTGKGTVVKIEQKGFADTVLWSPYGNEKMGYDKFICVEPVQASPVTAKVGKFIETKYYQKVSCKKI
jgi:D-hexose-6-phosphate mutarotase